MKAVPELLFASLIESDLLLNPYSGIETQLEKKATYMQSRVDKLQQYNRDADAGVTLTKSQDDARSKLDEVVKHQEYVKIASMQSKALSQSIVYSEILKQLDNPTSMHLFLTGSDGAVRLTENDLHALLRLRWAFSPTIEEYSSIEELERTTSKAADIVAAIISRSNNVVDTETGLQGKDVCALLESIKNSKFFAKGNFLWGSGGSENLESAPTDSSDKEAPPTTDSSSPSANEESDRSFEGKPNAVRVGGNDSVDFSDPEDFKCLVNSVVTDEVTNEKPTSASVRMPAGDSADEHIESTNGSDSGNGTVTPSSDIQGAPPKVTKSNRGGKQFFKNRASYYPRRVQDKASPQSGNPDDRIPKISNSVRANGEAQQRRRDERQNRRGARFNGFTSSNWSENENYQRPRNSRNGGGRANTQPPASFHYEPGIGRRPAPTTCGIVFGGRA
ncbi:hypothetical protein NECAME_02391 [Necator americanus]|uniref:Caprin-1 dimerization domain-containing protein n=1 Tax=Necator americanus TaxID=51031 RepID=W2TFB0_NECAM|nr:hypothetical protein NECAME_02391 [Necator americanus]ETN80259.1 hypothetical protein NECAME_02391 [Necator americanus]